MGLGFAANRLEMFHDNRFIELVRFTLFYGNRIDRAVAEAGAETVSEIVGNQPGLAVDNLDRAFGAGRNTEAAAVTLFFINFDHFTNHDFISLRIKLSLNVVIVALNLILSIPTRLDRSQVA